jgi:hypothetical protein
MALTTEWFCIGRSGPTIDGRIIKPEWLLQAAETYSPKTYTAKIWPDHNRYLSYGKVLALRAEKNDQSGVDLFATLAPNAYYQSDVRYEQKVHFSIEVTEDFAKTGKAYLSGLGATDDPASLGTSEAKFSRYAEQAGVYQAEFIEAETKTFADDTPHSLFAKFKTFLKNEANEEADMAGNKALEELKTEFAAMKDMLGKFTQQPGANGDDNPDEKNQGITAEQFTALTKRLDEFEAKFSQQPNGDADKTGDALKELTEKFESLQTKLNDALKEQPGTDAGQHFSANDTVLTDC